MTHVVARTAPSDSIRRLRWRERVVPTLWFLPTLFGIGAYVVSLLSTTIDQHLAFKEVPWWALGPQAAASLISTVASAMLTFLGVVFSTTLVAIQLASGQYSPRVVRVFVRSRLTQITLGIFLATFVFSLGAMTELRDDTHAIIPAVTVAITYWLLLGTLGAFISFLYGMSRMLRVQYLIEHITAKGRLSIEECLPAACVTTEASLLALPYTTVLRADRRTGVLQAIDRAGLVQLASRRNLVIELEIEPGEYIGKGCPIATVHHLEQAVGVGGDQITGFMLLGAERTLIHDAGFVLRQLVDIAIRALSPGVNDPTTATSALDRINDLLGDVVDRPDPIEWYADRAEVARLRLAEPNVARLLELGYAEVIRYGADSPQVVRHLRASLTMMAQLTNHPTVARLQTVLERAVASAMPAAFIELSSEADRHGLG